MRCITMVLTNFLLLIHSYFNIVKGKMIDIVLTQSYLAYACESLEGELATRAAAGALQA